MALSVDHQETQNPSLQNHVPGLAELAINQALQNPAKKRWFDFPKLIKFPKPAPKQNQPTTSKPATKPANKTRVVAANKTSKQGVEFASLAYLETSLQWVENLIHILTPRLLVAGFVLSMIDLLTNGNLLQNGYMIYVWAIIQAIAVDATLPNMWRLAFTRFDEKRWLAGSVLLVIGAGLAIVIFSALAIQFLQQAENLPLNVAMSKLHVNPEILSYVRSGSVVFLAAILSVLNRTKVTSKPQNQAVNVASSQNPSLQNPGDLTSQNQAVNFPGVQTSSQNQGLQNPSTEQNTGEIVSLPGLHLMDYAATENKQQQIRALLEANNELGVSEIVNLTGVSKGYASTQRTNFRKEKGLVVTPS